MNQTIEYRFAWDLQYLGEIKKIVIPAGYPGAAVSISCRKESGTMGTAVKIERWTPVGTRPLTNAPTLDVSANAADSAELSADDTRGVQMLALVNPAAQTCVIDVHVLIEKLPA